MIHDPRIILGGGVGPPRISDPWTTYCTQLNNPKLVVTTTLTLERVASAHFFLHVLVPPSKFGCICEQFSQPAVFTSPWGQLHGRHYGRSKKSRK